MNTLRRKQGRVLPRRVGSSVMDELTPPTAVEVLFNDGRYAGLVRKGRLLRVAHGYGLVKYKSAQGILLREEWVPMPSVPQNKEGLMSELNVPEDQIRQYQSANDVQLPACERSIALRPRCDQREEVIGEANWGKLPVDHLVEVEFKASPHELVLGYIAKVHGQLVMMPRTDGSDLVLLSELLIAHLYTGHYSWDSQNQTWSVACAPPAQVQRTEWILCPPGVLPSSAVKPDEGERGVLFVRPDAAIPLYHECVVRYVAKDGYELDIEIIKGAGGEHNRVEVINAGSCRIWSGTPDQLVEAAAGSGMWKVEGTGAREGSNRTPQQQVLKRMIRQHGEHAKGVSPLHPEPPAAHQQLQARDKRPAGGSSGHSGMFLPPRHTPPASRMGPAQPDQEDPLETGLLHRRQLSSDGEADSKRRRLAEERKRRGAEDSMSSGMGGQQQQQRSATPKSQRLRSQPVNQAESQHHLVLTAAAAAMGSLYPGATVLLAKALTQSDRRRCVDLPHDSVVAAQLPAFVGDPHHAVFSASDWMGNTWQLYLEAPRSGRDTYILEPQKLGKEELLQVHGVENGHILTILRCPGGGHVIDLRPHLAQQAAGGLSGHPGALMSPAAAAATPPPHNATAEEVQEAGGGAVGMEVCHAPVSQASATPTASHKPRKPAGAAAVRSSFRSLSAAVPLPPRISESPRPRPVAAPHSCLEVPAVQASPPAGLGPAATEVTSKTSAGQSAKKRSRAAAAALPFSTAGLAPLDKPTVGSSPMPAAVAERRPSHATGRGKPLAPDICGSPGAVGAQLFGWMDGWMEEHAPLPVSHGHAVAALPEQPHASPHVQEMPPEDAVPAACGAVKGVPPPPHQVLAAAAGAAAVGRGGQEGSGPAACGAVNRKVARRRRLEPPPADEVLVALTGAAAAAAQDGQGREEDGSPAAGGPPEVEGMPPTHEPPPPGQVPAPAVGATAAAAQGDVEGARGQVGGAGAAVAIPALPLAATFAEQYLAVMKYVEDAIDGGLMTKGGVQAMQLLLEVVDGDVAAMASFQTHFYRSLRVAANTGAALGPRAAADLAKLRLQKLDPIAAATLEGMP